VKSYHTFKTPPDPATYRPRGFYHWMSLTAGGYVCVLDSGAKPHGTWTPLPHLLDSTAAAGLTDYGCLATDTMFQAARKLAQANPFFEP